MVVESPSKAPKIESLLGKSQWRVLATKGHICVIDDGLKGLGELRTEGHIRYKTTNHAFVRELKKLMREEKTRKVYIGTDDDREGEAIGFHVCRLAGVDPTRMPRLRFNAIEKNALQAAVANPGTLDMDLVDAQMCRQAIDLALGYTASPLLWKAIGGTSSLSAGRCQTPALTLVCEHHKHAMSAEENMVWATDTYLPNFPLAFRGDAKQQTAEQEEIEWQLETWQEHETKLCTLKTKSRSVSVPQPLTTARLQQQCGMPTKRCMAAAQKLYEAGAITYHRTDSNGYCAPFVTQLGEHIRQTHGAEYAGHPRIVGKGAHEAIRATDPARQGLGKTGDERRLYKFIRQRTVASGMVPCRVEDLSRELTTSRKGDPEKRKLHAVASVTRMVFPGWTKEVGGGVVVSTPEQIRQLSELTSPPELKTPQRVDPRRTRAVPIVTGSRAPLTEAGLVKKLETVGVGRPSTYASIVNKLFDRRYAVVQDVPAKVLDAKEGVKEGKGRAIQWTSKQLEYGGAKARLAPTPLGERVNATCKQVFSELIEVNATAMMETCLDSIAKGERAWRTEATQYWDRVNSMATEGKQVLAAERKAATAATAAAASASAAEGGEGSGPGSGAAANTSSAPPLATLEDEPIHLKHGRYGPYLTWKGMNIKVKGRKMPNGGAAVAMVREHLATQAQVRDLGDGISIRPGKKGGKYAMVRKANSKLKPAFVNLKKCDIDLETGDAEALKQWINSQL